MNAKYKQNPAKLKFPQTAAIDFPYFLKMKYTASTSKPNPTR